MKDNFDKQFDDIKWLDDAELAKETLKKKQSIRLTNINNRQWGSEKTKQKRIKSIKNRWKKTEEREKQSERIKKHLKKNPRKLTKEQQTIKKEKTSQSVTEWHKDPKNRKKFKKAIAKRSEREPTKAQLEGYKKSGIKSRKILVTPYGLFDSFNVAKEKIKGLQNRLIILPHLYYYKEDGPGKPTYETIWNTPYGKTNHYGNKTELAERAGIKLGQNYSFKKWFEENSKIDPKNWYTSEEIRQDVTYVRKK